MKIREARLGELLPDLLQVLMVFVRQDYFNPSRRCDIVRLSGKCADRRHAENDREAQSVGPLIIR